jgi:putative aldouronate transport system permease protein
MFTLTWKNAGWSTILYLAAITSIDPSLYDAATIDGANRWHRIRYITWPGIQVIVITMLILRVGHMMDAGFDQIMNLYNPTVVDVADILDTYIYRITFQKTPNFGFSTAVGLFKGLTNCVLLLSVNWISKRVSGTGIL